MLARPIPVIDLFAGPGGLGEGFSSIADSSNSPVFDVRAAIEKDIYAYQTLRLRSFFRTFPEGKAPEFYYDHIRGHITSEEFYRSASSYEEWHKAESECHCATLGETPAELVDKWISEAIGRLDTWVLIGGPPCQAYSTVGRARMRNRNPHAFEQDKRHFLYKEYLRIIKKFKPTVFVMENVKGLLSSKHGGSPIFSQILEDLSFPEVGLEYELRSFVQEKTELSPKEFIIEAEYYGIPQRRHRVIIFGVRRDIAYRAHRPLIKHEKMVTVRDTLSGMPSIRSRLSKEPDSFNNWMRALHEAPESLKNWQSPLRSDVEDLMHCALDLAQYNKSIGAGFVKHSSQSDRNMPKSMADQLRDTRLGGVCQHEARSHMREDLHRYFFATCYSEISRISPKLNQFPRNLWPAHKNLLLMDTHAADLPFDDRFRVQCANLPSTTVVSHISKDGHYYIHPDPAQCRSLTVREAARLQTFPDNYFFKGSMLHQYKQIGNAVPPGLARQLAEIVADFLLKPASKRHKSNVNFDLDCHRLTNSWEERLTTP